MPLGIQRWMENKFAPATVRLHRTNSSFFPFSPLSLSSPSLFPADLSIARAWETCNHPYTGCVAFESIDSLLLLLPFSWNKSDSSANYSQQPQSSLLDLRSSRNERLREEDLRARRIDVYVDMIGDPREKGSNFAIPATVVRYLILFRKLLAYFCPHLTTRFADKSLFQLFNNSHLELRSHSFARWNLEIRSHFREYLAHAPPAARYRSGIPHRPRFISISSFDIRSVEHVDRRLEYTRNVLQERRMIRGSRAETSPSISANALCT